MRSVGADLEYHINLVRDVLASKPARPWIERPVLRGEPVASFVLPLRLCPTRNAGRREHWGSRARLREETLDLMRLQFYTMRRYDVRFPLGGRPQVLAIRFSSALTDVDAGFAKQAVDCLTPKACGLGIIKDDSRRYADRAEWCEYAPPGKGFVFIEVRTT